VMLSMLSGRTWVGGGPLSLLAPLLPGLGIVTEARWVNAGCAALLMVQVWSCAALGCALWVALVTGSQPGSCQKTQQIAWLSEKAAQ
jgi:hypothetical protein